MSANNGTVHILARESALYGSNSVHLAVWTNTIIDGVSVSLFPVPDTGYFVLERESAKHLRDTLDDYLSGRELENY